jgi:hypothetical protein
MSRIAGTVLAIACFLGGYAVAGHRAGASGEDVAVRRLPHTIHAGDRVTLTFAAGALATGTNELDCKVAYLNSIWVQCGTPGELSGSGREHPWYDTTRVVSVRKTER